MAKASIRIRLRRPRNDSLGAMSGEECATASEHAASTTRELQYGFTVSPHRRASRLSPPTSEVMACGKMLEETHMRPMQHA